MLDRTSGHFCALKHHPILGDRVNTCGIPTYAFFHHTRIEPIMGIKIEVKGLDELQRELSDPNEFAHKMVEKTIRSEVEALIALAKDSCADKNLAESISFSLTRTSEKYSLTLNPDEALPEFCRAHNELRGSFADPTNALLDMFWEKNNL